ncbi:IS1-like element transposase [Siphonobacter sp. SORGH_AS_1065]|uniref:IS1-like element transposase n=1 Tax=Siphonobacter sp. SORGH_AS_1065 TaxID=3041795 RepID=UPI00358FBFA4
MWRPSHGKTFVKSYVNRGHERAVQDKIVEMALNGNGVRETGRVLGISSTVELQ